MTSLDRGKKPKECLRFANKMHRAGRAILIKGNHEWLLEELLRKWYPESHDIHNGTYDTVKILNGKKDYNSDVELFTNVRKNRTLKYYLDHVVDFAEIGNNIFVHGWLPMTYNSEEDMWLGANMHIVKDWRDQPSWVWEEATWYNGMFQWHQGNKIEGKTIWCGHWHCSYGNSHYHNDGVEFLEPLETFYKDPITGKTEPHENHHTFKDDGIVALDACTVHSHFVNVEVIDV